MDRIELSQEKLDEIDQLMSQCKSKEEFEKRIKLTNINQDDLLTFNVICLINIFIQDYKQLKSGLSNNENTILMCDKDSKRCPEHFKKAFIYKRAFHNQLKIISEEYLNNLKLFSEDIGIKPSFDEVYQLYKKEASNES